MDGDRRQDQVAAARRNALPGRIGLTALVLLLVGAVTGVGTHAAFSGTTANTSTWASGTVRLSDDDQGAAAVSMTDGKPGSLSERCVAVTFDGSLASAVRLYGSDSGTGLGTYLDLTITRGTGGSFTDCSGFTPDGAIYAAAQGVLYTGTLADFTATRSSWTTGLLDPTAASPESWTTGETHVYKISVRLRADNAAQGKTSQPTFTWQARSS